MWTAALIILALASTSPAFAQEPTALPYVHALVDGQQTRFDFVVRAGQVHMSLLLTLLIFSVWAFFLFAVLFWLSQRRNAQ